MALGLCPRWFHRWGLVAGWVGGMGLGTFMLYLIPNAATKRERFGGSAFPLSMWFDPTSIGLDARTTVYVGFIAVAVKLVVAVLVTLLMRAVKAPDGIDLTSPDDYFADENSPGSDRPQWTTATQTRRLSPRSACARKGPQLTVPN